MPAVRISRWVLLGALLLLGVGVGWGDEGPVTGYHALTGYWDYEANYLKINVGFVPDSRYFIEMKGGDAAPTYERGTYQVAGGTLRFITPSEGMTVYEFSLAGNTLTLKGGLFAAGGAFVKQPGSETRILEDLRRFDEAQEQANAPWREKIPVGVLDGPRRGVDTAVGEILPDPNPARIFQGDQVFRGDEVYFQIGAPQEIQFEDGTRKIVTGHWHGYFFPNGRVYVHCLSYLPGGPADGRVLRAWGRYRITPGGREEPLLVESDEGEQLAMTLVDGRRNLLWNGGGYTNLKWQQARDAQP